jgi:cullin-4
MPTARDSTTRSGTSKAPASSRAAAAPSQKTISELFSATTKPPDSYHNHNHDKASSVKLATDTSVTPRHKRQKLQHSSSPSSSVTSEHLAPHSMYSFPSSRPRPNGATDKSVVDLTASSPNSSPKKLTTRPRPNLHPELGVKKIQVKNLRTVTRTDPRQYFTTTWAKLDKSVTAVYGGEKVEYSLEELYKGVENVCRQQHAEELNSKLEQRAREHVKETVRRKLLDQVDSSSNLEVLRAVVSAWKTWVTQMDYLRGIFLYMDRAYLLPAKKPCIHDMSVSLFRHIIFNDRQLQPKIVSGVCDFVTADRSGDSSDQQLARQAVSMFNALGVYTQVIEPRLLKESQTFAREWADKSVKQKDLATYLKDAVVLMDTEVTRCDILGLEVKSTKRDLLALLEHHLIERQQGYLLDTTAIAQLLDNNAVDDLERLYSLLARKQLEEKLRTPFEEWIDKTGTTIVFDEKLQDDMVVRLLTMKSQLDNLWREAFHRNSEIGHGLRKAFEVFINKTKKSSGTWGTDNSKPGEMIAKYVDMLLRGGSKVIPAALIKNPVKPTAAEEEEDNEDVDEDQQVDSQLEQVLDLFRFVHGKAVFEAFYKKDLARRLLMGRSASADAERSMLSRLETECGSGFTQNLSQMFKDIELGREEMTSYKEFLTDLGTDPPVDLNVSILSSSAWPSYPDIKVNIPREVSREIERFEEHYKTKHTGRRLEWKHALAHCQLRATFPKGRKEIVVSSFQAIVLLLFNNVAEDEHISYERLLAETGLREYLKRHTVMPPTDIANSRQRTPTNPAIARLRQAASSPQTPRRQRGQPHRHLHLQCRLHHGEIPRQDQPGAAQGDQGGEQGDARAHLRGPQL